MTPILKVLITDPNRFFVVGLKKLLIAHFREEGITLVFISDQMPHSMADLIFLAPDHAKNGLIPEKNYASKSFIVMSNGNRTLIKMTLQKIFHRRQSCTELLALVDEVINKRKTYQLNKHTEKYNSLALLTPRQKEVMYYFSKGMRLNEIAENMHVHVKTVSTHKQAAMNKLQLRRLTELHNWLINNPIEPVRM